MASSKYNSRFQYGQSLIEVVIALAIATLVLVALANGVTTSIRNSRFAKDKSQATELAQDTLEAVRSIRDNNWLSLTAGTHGIQKSGVYWMLTDAATAEGAFTREIQIADGVQNTKTITVTISWSEGGAPQKVVLHSTLYLP